MLKSTSVTAPETRPSLHFTPPTGWMNDPNGLVCFDDEYHLFYQYYADEPIHGPMHWGHAVSQDLCHWKHKPIALAPDALGTCFSGSAVVDEYDSSGLFDGEAGLVAFYTVHRVINTEKDEYLQEQCLAYSKDAGKSWHKYAKNPVIATPGFADFRDPKVIWHDSAQHWVMALACGQTLRFYKSDDLLSWQFTSEFGQGQGTHTHGPWECPDLFELPVEGADDAEHTRWVLIVGVGADDVEPDQLGSFTQYFIGDFDGEVFHNDNSANTTLLMDEGRDFYAVQSWSNTRKRRLAIAWLNNWQYAKEIPHNGWRGNMTLVRELFLRQTSKGVRLVQQFAKENQKAVVQDVSPAKTGSFSQGVHELAQASSQLSHGIIKLKLADSSQAALSLQQGDQQLIVLNHTGDNTEVSYTRKGEFGTPGFDAYFKSDRACGSVDGNEITLEWWIDRGSLEVLVNGTSQQIAISNVSFLAPQDYPVALVVTSGSVDISELTLKQA